MLKEQLQEKIKRALKTSFHLSLAEVPLEVPHEAKYGDYASSLPLILAKSLKQSPLEIANGLKEALGKDNLLGVECQVAAPGFLNFTLNAPVLLAETEKIFQEGDNFGRSQDWVGKKLMVEFAHPNTHKEFHIGHLRNLCLGESLVRLLEAQGAKVIRANYQGDVGLHVAKALWGIEKLMSNKAIKLSSLEKKPLRERVKLLGQAYVEGHKAYAVGTSHVPAACDAAGGVLQGEVMDINRKIYAQDPSILPLWRETRQWSLDYFAEIYQRLGSHFDRFYFESEVAAAGVALAREAQAKGILKESEGAVVFDGAPYGLDTRVFITGEGLPTYEAKELGLAALEFSEFGEIDKCVHVVAPEQASFFRVTFKVEELWDAAKFAGRQEHFAYGYVDLKEGKMSSRAGRVVAALDVLAAAKEKARRLFSEKVAPSLEGATFTEEEREKVSEKVAVGAVKYSLLKQSARKNIAFDLEESVALAGNSGPYLQYTYARAQAVLRKSSLRSDLAPRSDLHEKDAALAPEELALLRTFHRFPEIVSEAAQNYAPHLVAEYLYDLAQKFNLFYNNVRILPREFSNVIPAEAGIQEVDSGSPRSQSGAGMTNEVSNFRLALTAAAAQVIKNGLYLLGVATLERM